MSTKDTEIFKKENNFSKIKRTVLSQFLIITFGIKICSLLILKYLKTKNSSK